MRDGLDILLREHERTGITTHTIDSPYFEAARQPLRSWGGYLLNGLWESRGITVGIDGWVGLDNDEVAKVLWPCRYDHLWTREGNMEGIENDEHATGLEIFTIWVERKRIWKEGGKLPQDDIF